jgi:hypothetical protein
VYPALCGKKFLKMLFLEGYNKLPPKKEKFLLTLRR